MKKLILIWSFAVVLIALPFVFSASNVIYNHTFSTTGNFTLNAGCTINTVDGYLESSTSSGCLYGNRLINLSTNKVNWSIVFYGLNLSISGGNVLIVFSPRNNSAWTPGASSIAIAGSSGTPNVPRMYFWDANNVDTYPGLDIMSANPNTPFELRLTFLPNESFNTYVNGTFTSNQPLTLGAKMNENITFFRFQDGGGGSRLRVKGFVIYNTSETSTPEGPDTTPPNIISYNMTSEGGAGCTNWNNSKSNPCNTSDTTPTVAIITNESADCRIGVSDLNYTDLGSSRECTSSGISHTCTLTPQDELTYETSFVYIGCHDIDNNENRTSTSGALALNVTGLETTARNSIELGIKNALISDYAIYTDQRIYARNSANNQSTGVFDKVVKKLNKLWAFNRIGISDSHVNMFNITPVFYTLEFANKTSAYIENQTAVLINSTK